MTQTKHNMSTKEILWNSLAIMFLILLGSSLASYSIVNIFDLDVREEPSQEVIEESYTTGINWTNDSSIEFEEGNLIWDTEPLFKMGDNLLRFGTQNLSFNIYFHCVNNNFTEYNPQLEIINSTQNTSISFQEFCRGDYGI